MLNGRTSNVIFTAVLAVALGAALAAGGVASTARGDSRAATSVYLGRATSDAPNSYVPLGGFRRIPQHMTQFGRPDVELMGTAIDDQTAAVEWPLMKALSQFGELVNPRPGPQSCPHIVPTPMPGGYNLGMAGCGVPSFDLSRVVYRSPYINFRPRMLLDARGRLRVETLSPSERRIYDGYGRVVWGSDEVENIWASLAGQLSPRGNPNADSARLPLVMIGNYLERRDGYVFAGATFGGVTQGSVASKPWFIPFLSYGEAQTALAKHQPPRVPAGESYNGSLLSDVNTDANLMTALICHADGSQPASVCSRAVIRKILKHVR